MSALAWKLKRLSAMSPLEIARRAGTALRDRTLPPAYARWTPDQAFERLFGADWEAAVHASRLDRLDRLARLPAGVGAIEPAVAAARELRAGRWSIFGHPVKLDDPPRWRRDYVTGEEWPDRRSRALDYRSSGLAGGAKATWELGRLTALPTLALGARLTGERAYAEQAARWLADFTRENALGRGIHHTSGIEDAIRVITTTWTLALLAGGPGGAPRDLAGSLGLVVQQALHCGDHLSLGSSANNHLIAEYAAMAIAGATFPAAAAAAGAPRLLEQGQAGLEREVLRQIHPDGVPAEQALGYLPFVWELLLPALVACEAAGRVVSAAVRERLAASLELARAVRLPNGRWPQIGDEDDARILIAVEGLSRLDLAGNALAAWLGVDGLGGEQALARLLIGRPAGQARVAADGAHEFGRGGLTVWKSAGLTVTFDHGPLGLPPLAAHGHADGLSLTLYDGATPVVVDPGTFAYHEDEAARARCRGTPGHATVQFGGHSQSTMLGPFLWGSRAAVVRRGDGWECRWVTGERHLRRVYVRGREVAIEDQVWGPGAELCFTLAPFAQVQLEGRRAIVKAAGSTAVFEAEGIAPWRREVGEVAPRFASVVAAPRLAASLAAPSCRTVIRLG
ncbi:MAG TPA: heparinase II/III-family protein [Candidatus Eisenbacteria bacterium]